MKYLAYTYPNLVLLHPDVPLGDVTLESGENAIPYLTGILDEVQAYSRIRVEGTTTTVPLIREHGTLIIPVPDNQRRGRQELTAYVVISATEDYVEQETTQIIAEGLEGIPHGVPWMAPEKAYIDTDPLQIHREIWEHATGFDDVPDVEIQPARSPVRVGEEERDVTFTDSAGNDVEFTAGPFRLRAWAEHDLGKIIDDLADETPFAHYVATIIDFGDATAPIPPPRFVLRRQYPAFDHTIRDNLHFEVGHNATVPEADDDPSRDYYSHVIVWGSGEGSRRRRGEAYRPGHNRGRSVLVIEEPALTTNQACVTHAKKLLGISRGGTFYDTVTVRDSPAAPFGSFGLGDQILLKIPQVGRSTIPQRSRIIGLDHDLKAQGITLTLAPAD